MLTVLIEDCFFKAMILSSGSEGTNSMSGILFSFIESKAGCNFFFEERDGKQLLLPGLPRVSYCSLLFLNNFT